MDYLILISLLLVFFGSGLGVVYLFPIFFTKWRASVLGLHLNFPQAKIITKNYCNKKDFLLKVKEILFWENIPIEKLVHHYSAKGDLTNLRDGIIEMKHKNKDIDFSILATFDLAGWNLVEEIKKAESKNWVFSWVRLK